MRFVRNEDFVRTSPYVKPNLVVRLSQNITNLFMMVNQGRRREKGMLRCKSSLVKVASLPNMDSAGAPFEKSSEMVAARCEMSIRFRLTFDSTSTSDLARGVEVWHWRLTKVLLVRNH